MNRIASTKVFFFVLFLVSVIANNGLPNDALLEREAKVVMVKNLHPTPNQPIQQTSQQTQIQAQAQAQTQTQAEAQQESAQNPTIAADNQNSKQSNVQEEKKEENTSDEENEEHVDPLAKREEELLFEQALNSNLNEMASSLKSDEISDAIGFAKTAKNVYNLQNKQGSSSRINGAADKITVSDTQCVLCQFFVQEMKSDMAKFSASLAGSYPSYGLQSFGLSVVGSPYRPALYPQTLTSLSPSTFFYPNIYLEEKSHTKPNQKQQQQHPHHPPPRHHEENNGDAEATDVNDEMDHPPTSSFIASHQRKKVNNVRNNIGERVKSIRTRRNNARTNSEIEHMRKQHQHTQQHRTLSHLQHQTKLRKIVPNKQKYIPRAHNRRFVSNKHDHTFLETSSQYSRDRSGIGYSFRSPLNDPSSQITAPRQGLMTPRRFRAADMLSFRPRRQRIDTIHAPNPNPARDQIRYLQNTIENAVFQSFEGVCASRVPESFLPFCQKMGDLFRFIGEGLRFGDRSDQICMRIEFCSPSSYLNLSPHSQVN